MRLAFRAQIFLGHVGQQVAQVAPSTVNGGWRDAGASRDQGYGQFAAAELLGQVTDGLMNTGLYPGAAASGAGGGFGIHVAMVAQIVF